MSGLRVVTGSLGLLGALCCVSASLAAPARRGAAAVDGARIVEAARHPGDWLTCSRSYSAQRAPIKKHAFAAL